ncbi:MAG: Grx4 family monothiol glutaredoxin [Gammaproteobacteria bacterium]|nr:Grx4 family monothiol glutaredoxin [Gammaproteobacteria bacterium]
MKTTDKIRKQLAENPMILYMKGSPTLPMCGFSAKAAQALKDAGHDFAYVDVLMNPQIMQALPEVSDFPTFPQLFVGGELIGGSDIIEAMLESGKLQPLIEAARPETPS